MSRKIPIALVLAIVSIGSISVVTLAADGSEDQSEASVSVENTGSLPDDLGAVMIEPDPTVTSPRPHAWDRIVVSSDGLGLDIYFWMGIEDCNGLHNVTASPTRSGIDVALQTGIPAGAEDMVCIEIALLYVSSVTLDEPLITNAQ